MKQLIAAVFSIALMILVSGGILYFVGETVEHFSP